MTLDLWTFDAGTAAATPTAFAEECLRRVEQSWDEGADLVLFPEYCWLGLEQFVQGNDPLAVVSRLFWRELLPGIQRRLSRAGKAAVLGTCPHWDERRARLSNRAVIIREGELLAQDKLWLTPWESAFAAGETLRLWQFSGLRIAVLVCLDIEVPETAAKLRGRGVDLILVPSATETVLGVERIGRCASARAVELGCQVAVAHLTGRTQSELIDENIGRTALFSPSQAAFAAHQRLAETPVVTEGFHHSRHVLSAAALQTMRAAVQETNPALLRVEAGVNFSIETEPAGR